MSYKSDTVWNNHSRFDMLLSSGFYLGRGPTGGSMRRLIIQTLPVLTLNSTLWPARLGQVMNEHIHLCWVELFRKRWHINLVKRNKIYGLIDWLKKQKKRLTKSSNTGFQWHFTWWPWLWIMLLFMFKSIFIFAALLTKILICFRKENQFRLNFACFQQ